MKYARYDTEGMSIAIDSNGNYSVGHPSVVDSNIENTQKGLIARLPCKGAEPFTIPDHWLVHFPTTETTLTLLTI